MENNSVVIPVEKYDYFKRLEKNAEELPEGMIRVTRRSQDPHYGCTVEHKTYDIKKEDYNKELNDKITELEADIAKSRQAQGIRERQSVQVFTKVAAIESLIDGKYPFLSYGLVKKIKLILGQ